MADSLRSTGPQRAGAVLGAAIAFAWMLGSLALAVAGTLFSSVVAETLGWIAVVGSIAAIPAAAVMGRLFAWRPLTERRVVLPMSIGTTVAADLAISLTYSAYVAIALVASGIHDDPMVAIGQAIVGFLLIPVLAVPAGLFVFGLPGLVVSAISAFVWGRLMRRLFPAVITASG